MMKEMERKTSRVALPPYSSCTQCKNRLSDLCVEDCAPSVDYRWFVLRAGVSLEDRPSFPLDELLLQMPLK